MIDVWCVVVACFGGGRVFQWASGSFSFVQWARMYGLAGSCRFGLSQFFRLTRKKCSRRDAVA